MSVSFDQLPPHARLWVYPSSRPLTAGEEELVHRTLTGFVGAWAAHGHPLRAAFQVADAQLILLAVDEAAAGASGCSIDASVRMLRDLEQRLGVVLLDRGRVVIRKDGALQFCAPAALRAAVADGTLAPATMVVNTTAGTLGEWRAQPETAAARTWLNRYFMAQTER